MTSRTRRSTRRFWAAPSSTEYDQGCHSLMKFLKFWWKTWPVPSRACALCLQRIRAQRRKSLKERSAQATPVGRTALNLIGVSCLWCHADSVRWCGFRDTLSYLFEFCFSLPRFFSIAGRGLKLSDLSSSILSGVWLTKRQKREKRASLSFFFLGGLLYIHKPLRWSSSKVIDSQEKEWSGVLQYPSPNWPSQFHFSQ